jgi:hypothetical protein
MPQMDRAMARALTEAGYMPLGEYIRQFGGEAATLSARPLPRFAGRRSHPSNVQGRFSTPLVANAGYKIIYRRKRT